MVLITMLAAGGVAVSSATFAYWQNQKTQREIEETKQAEAEVEKLQVAQGDVDSVVSTSDSKVDDLLLTIRKAAPWIALAVGGYFAYSYAMKKSKK